MVHYVNNNGVVNIHIPYFCKCVIATASILYETVYLKLICTAYISCVAVARLTLML